LETKCTDSHDSETLGNETSTSLETIGELEIGLYELAVTGFSVDFLRRGVT